MTACAPVSEPAAAPAASSPLKDMAHAIRALAMDAVEVANSGHPGMPMGCADMAAVLWTKFLRFDASCPDWPNRDRFVLSAGHGSMLLYALAYLTGYEALPLEELKKFRQLGSRTPGHPEHDVAIGVETTTGPLGQGLATAVGMAMAERHLQARFGVDLVAHYTYVIASDGDLMEGISHEAASLAGHLKLAKLIVLYDDNKISIDGSTDLSFTDDTRARFAAYGWHTEAVDGHDMSALEAALTRAQRSDAPTLIACRTIIGYGAPGKAGSEKCHGSPLGAAEIEGARTALGWTAAPFEIPADILEAWRTAGARGAAERTAWEKTLAAHAQRGDFMAALSGAVPEGAWTSLQAFKEKLVADAPKLATRQASGNTLDVLVPQVPGLLGGSADLTGSNLTLAKGTGAFAAATPGGRYVYYGVREHGMAAAMNGMALHGGVIPYGGTFLQFADYCRPAIRLSALMHQRVIYVMTHDSIGLGEDGPTHQPVEHLASLRAIPNLVVLRPADAVETAEAWEIALRRTDGPCLLALTRQGLPTLRRDVKDNLSARGGYVLLEAEGGQGPQGRQVTLLASGSEVSLAAKAREILAQRGVRAAVVSVPSFELFRTQSAEYRAQVLGTAPRVAVEAAIRQGWDEWLGADGVFIGMRGFGASAPAEALYKHFGITAEAVADSAQKLVAG